MAGITISGSSMNVQSIVSQLMTIEQVPLNQINTKITQTESKISALGTLKSRLSALQTAATAMSTPSKIQGANITVTSSNDAAVSAVQNGTPTVGDKSVMVTSLAKSQVLESASYSSATTNLGINGSFTLERGTWSGSTFSADASKGSVTVSTNGKSLTQIQDAINAAGVGVTASISQDTSGFKLVVTSNDTGTASEIRMKKASGLSNAFAYDLANVSAGMKEAVSGSDTNYSIDGTSYTTSGFTASHGGIDYTFKALATSPVKVSATLDTSKLKTVVNDFINAYNSVQSYISAVAPVGPDSTGILKNDSSVRNLLYSLRKSVTSPVGTGSLRQLTMMGVQFQKDGSLSLDQTTFDKVVSANQQGVVDMLSGANGGKGVMDMINDRISAINSTDGLIGARIDGLRRLSTTQKSRATKLQDRLPQIETMLYTKYSKLDAAITNMQTTMSGLTTSLAALAANTTTTK